MTSETTDIAAVNDQSDTVLLDEVTRQRLFVAECCADTLDRIAETRTWDRLDPAIAEHLLSQAEILGRFLVELEASAPVQGSEYHALTVRRLLERLGLATDLLRTAKDEREQATAALPLAGDESSQPGPGAGMTPRQLGLAWAGAVFCLVVGCSVLGLGIAAQVLQARPFESFGGEPAPILAERPNLGGTTLASILPVTYAVTNRGGEISAGVPAEWIARPESDRQAAAVAIQAYLVRNDAPSIVLYGPDYRAVATIERDWMAWEDGTSVATK